MEFLNEQIQPSERTKLYLCAPWPVRNDGSFYGIDVFKFNAKTNEWQRRIVIEFNEENDKHGFGCVCVRDKLFIIGGERCFKMYGQLKFDIFDDIESYDINTGSKETLPCIPSGGRSLFWTIAVGKFVYIFGGINRDQRTTNECMRFDAEFHWWETLHPMPEEYSRPFGQNSIRELNGLIYVACGPYSEAVYVYDPSVDIWSQLTSSIVTIEHPLMFKRKESLHIVGDGVLYRYDVAKDTWTSIKMNADDKDIFGDAIELLGETFTWTFASSKSIRSSFGRLKIEKLECTFIPIDAGSMIFRPGCLLFTN